MLDGLVLREVDAARGRNGSRFPRNLAFHCRVEAEFLVGRRRRIEELHEAAHELGDGDVVVVEARGELGLEGGEFFGEFARVGEQAAHADEGADDMERDSAEVVRPSSHDPFWRPPKISSQTMHDFS